MATGRSSPTQTSRSCASSVLLRARWLLLTPSCRSRFNLRKFKLADESADVLEAQVEDIQPAVPGELAPALISMGIDAARVRRQGIENQRGELREGIVWLGGHDGTRCTDP